MCELPKNSNPPGSGARPSTASTESGATLVSGIGALFRAHGEAYISSYHPDRRVIGLIRSIRLCRTAALGGRRYTCPDCSGVQYRYFSCGHSHCPLCQGNKRKAWYERVEAGLLTVPYCHITFTLPHELNGVCRLHPSILYGMLFRTAWQTLRELCAEPNHLGGLPGMTAVLHTWGSDLKHHVHLHCLVTFGGLDQQHGRWQWPKSKLKLLRYRPIRNRFRDNFLKALKSWMKAAGSDIYHQSYELLTADLLTKNWVVNQQPPTMDATVINAYLSRYICRIGISDKRLQYDPITQQVSLVYNDYRKQQGDQPPPTAILQLPPLLAMDKILQHLLPPRFHRTRHYGLHAPSTRKRLAPQLKRYVKSAPSTVLVVLRLLKAMLQLSSQLACQQCGSLSPPLVEEVAPDHNFKYTFLHFPQRGPPLAPCPINPKQLNG